MEKTFENQSKHMRGFFFKLISKESKADDIFLKCSKKKRRNKYSVGFISSPFIAKTSYYDDVRDLAFGKLFSIFKVIIPCSPNAKKVSYYCYNMHARKHLFLKNVLYFD